MINDSFNLVQSEFGDKQLKHNAVVIKSKFCSWEVKTEASKKFVQFKIKIVNLLFNFTIQKRYSDFTKFHQDLVLEFPKIAWPELPKKFFFQNFDPDKLNLRMLQLELYLNKVLDIYSKNDDIFSVPQFINLHNNNVHSLLDLNQSTVSILDPVTIAYIRLIYEPKQKTTKNIESLNQILLKQPVSPYNAKLILIGDSSLVNIFVIAFCAEAYFQQYLKEEPKRNQVKSKSFNQNFLQDNAVQEVELEEESCHHICTVVSSFILALFDYGLNKNAQLFRGLLRNVNLKFFDSQYFLLHLNSRQNSQCKLNCFEILHLLQMYNPVTQEEFFQNRAFAHHGFQEWLHYR